MGIVIKGGVESRPDLGYGVVQDLTIWRIRGIGVWGYTRSRAPIISNVRVADSSDGFFWSNIGMDPEKHQVELQTIAIQDSLFVGRSFNNPICKAQTAILLPIFASGGHSISPTTCGPLGGGYTEGIYGMEHPTGSNPAIAGEVRVSGTTFVRFQRTALNGNNCGASNVLQTTMRGGMESSDAVPPHFFSRITIDADSRANLADLPPPKRSWIMPSKCVVLDCDGPKHVMLHDLDGSLTGVGAGASITARAEFMNELRDDITKFTWYNIPTKMLYDPAPYNDPGDPGWDMSAYAAYNNGAQTFTYRRLEGSDANASSELIGVGIGSVAAELPPPLMSSEEAAAATAAEENERRTRRALSSATDSDWRNRMVFFTGDERIFYAGQTGASCEPTSAIYDPACRSIRKTRREVAYRGYGTYRHGCELNRQWNAWLCNASSMQPARLVIESMDEDHTSRNLAPVALASGGYVDLFGGGWDHQRAKDCGGYDCLKRLSTFHTTIAINRSYDLAFTGTNPKNLRLMLPSGGGEATQMEMLWSRVVISIFYSNPQKLEVHYQDQFMPPMEAHMLSSNSYNFSMRKPVISDSCGSNAFAAWENKLYVLVCGGVPGVEIKTVDKIVLSLGIEVTIEEFFDAQYLVRNLASLFGIPSD
ncbi:fibrocystin-l [Chrysochromulina tobinii]|uniref:Fibrocystin-l n=1 Tax=Chrysochromulina tobinii TaxID=1460289 RepID=A0A0M0JD89_9EUKA|nr:fibrocystin-l [Chrysochromulina tobinii]|eukprot:KOO24193.1 fibrocystin-l [Chrysochromulina sp. CCMP291]